MISYLIYKHGPSNYLFLSKIMKKIQIRMLVSELNTESVVTWSVVYCNLYCILHARVMVNLFKIIQKYIVEEFNK